MHKMKSDIPMKRILQVRPEDWISFLFPKLTKINITEMATNKVPKAESRMDNLTFVNNEFILHIEPKGYLDKALPCRMLRYRSDTWEYTISKDLGTPTIKQGVIFFFQNHDNGMHQLTDEWEENDPTLDFSYKTIKIWEIEKEKIIN